MFTIAIVDDKSENRSQVRNSLPGSDFDIKEYESFDSFSIAYSKGLPLPDILILDYFLEHGKTGVDLLNYLYTTFPEAKSKVKVIGFSSILACSERLATISGGHGLEKNKFARSNSHLTSLISKYILNK